MISQFSPVTPESPLDNMPQFPPSRARTPLKNFVNSSHDTLLAVDLVHTDHNPVVEEESEEDSSTDRSIPDSPDASNQPRLLASAEIPTKSINTASRLGETRLHRDDVDLASASSFQFPQPSKLHNATQRPVIRQTEGRSPPTRAPISQVVHQNTHSLDTSTTPLTQDHFFPSIVRTRSATTPIPQPTAGDDPDFLENPSVNTENKRLADLNFAPPSRSTPGLKDVLKVNIPQCLYSDIGTEHMHLIQIPSLSSSHHMGITDLLPPSPAALPGQRHFPSLSANPSTPNFAIQEESTAFYDSDSSSHRTEQQRLLNSSLSSLGSSPLGLPRPLNYSSLIGQRAAIDAELDQTLKSLSSWLAVVESSLNSVLDNIIEEETDMGFENLTMDDLRPESSTLL